MRRDRELFLVLGILGLLPLSACDRLCGDEEPANVAGRWIITGEGECLAQEGVDSEVNLQAQLEIPIAQSGDGSRLALAGPVSGGAGSFSFTGSVDGSCVDFTIQESGPGYSVSYDFKGVVHGSDDTITGDLKGTGPDLCTFEGSFEVSVFASTDTKPSPDGGLSIPDAGAVDAGSSTTADAGRGSPRECYHTKDCEEGICLNGKCVPECSTASDCSLGEKCSSRRCEEAQGCNCSVAQSTPGGSGLPVTWLALLGCLAIRSIRRSPRCACRRRRSRSNR